MFVVYNKDMNLMAPPEGVMPLDIKISSLSKKWQNGQVEGSSRKISYGQVYNDRDIYLEFRLEAQDTQDYRLLRDEVYYYFSQHEYIYVCEKYQPGKRYKVTIIDSYTPERLNKKVASVVLKAELFELPFAESIGTSADIDNPELIPMIPELWMQGYWALNGSGVLNSSTNIRTNADTKIHLTPGEAYELTSFGDYEARINIYSENDHLSYFHSGKNDSNVFTAPNEAIYGRISIRQYQGNEDINPNMIGKEIKISMKKTTSGINSGDELWGFGMGLISDDDSLIYTHNGTEFKIFNPGIEVHPFEQDLTIEISDVEGSTSYLQLENMSTGDVFRVTEAVNDNQLIKLDGPNITSNNLQYLRKTNRKYITLAPGWNNFKITGATSAKVSFDTRFYYL